jgi:hypothetical protein
MMCDVGQCHEHDECTQSCTQSALHACRCSSGIVATYSMHSRQSVHHLLFVQTFLFTATDNV